MKFFVFGVVPPFMPQYPVGSFKQQIFLIQTRFQLDPLPGITKVKDGDALLRNLCFGFITLRTPGEHVDEQAGGLEPANSSRN